MAARDGERDPVERDDAAEADGDVLDLEQRLNDGGPWTANARTIGAGAGKETRLSLVQTSAPSR
jgi:hypothetical protein